MIITIDGPTASGKSTIAKMLAKDLGFDYLYTGLLYRALGYILMKNFGYTLKELKNPREEDVKKVLDSSEFVYTYNPASGAQISFNGENITPYLKKAEVDDWSSLVSVNKAVRQEMVAYQRAYAQKHNTVVEGRDIATVVFPYAKHKFFLTASLEERARRWQEDQKQFGKDFSLEESMKQVAMRDERDSTREISPLKVADDAIVIDATQLTLQETLEEIKKYIVL